MDLLRRSALPAWLLWRFGSASALAAAINVTRQTAHNLITGRTSPSDKHCEELGIVPAFLLPEKKIRRDLQSLDDFLAVRELDRRKEDMMTKAGLSETPLSSERGAAMWKGLIHVTRGTTMRVGMIDGIPLQWDDGPPLGKSLSPLLKLHPVGAQFKELRATPFSGAPRSCTILFGWVTTPMGSRKQMPPDRLWTLTLSRDGGEPLWCVNDGEIVGASSVELAGQIVKQLIEYRDEYESA